MIAIPALIKLEQGCYYLGVAEENPVLAGACHSRVGDEVGWLNRCAFRQMGGFYPVMSHQVQNGFTVYQQVVGNDAPVTAPPDGLGTHDGTSVFPTQCDQFAKAIMERVGKRVIGKIVKALVLPETVDIRRYCF